MIPSTVDKGPLGLSGRGTCRATFELKGNQGETHGVNDRQAGLYRAFHATLCCVTLGKSPTLSALSTMPDTDTPHRDQQTVKKKGIKAFMQENDAASE